MASWGYSFAATLPRSRGCSARQIRTDCPIAHARARDRASFGIRWGSTGTSPHSLEVSRYALDRRADCRVRVRRQPAPRHPARLVYRQEHCIFASSCRDPEVYSNSRDFASVGVAAARGQRPTIITTGPRCTALEQTAGVAEEGIGARVVDMHTVKPLDAAEIRAAAAETGAILSVEEHSVIGGLGSAIAEILVDLERIPFRRHGVYDEFAPVGPPAALYEHYKLDAAGIAETARALLGGR